MSGGGGARGELVITWEVKGPLSEAEEGRGEEGGGLLGTSEELVVPKAAAPVETKTMNPPCCTMLLLCQLLLTIKI